MPFYPSLYSICSASLPAPSFFHCKTISSPLFEGKHSIRLEHSNVHSTSWEDNSLSQLTNPLLFLSKFRLQLDMSHCKRSDSSCSGDQIKDLGHIPSRLGLGGLSHVSCLDTELIRTSDFLMTQLGHLIR